MVKLQIFFIFTPILGRLEDSLRVIGRPRCCLSDHKCHDFRALAIAAGAEPSWHRRRRTRRSRARALIKNFVAKPTRGRARRIVAAVTLLEAHHSRPSYSLVRKVMSKWNQQQNGWKANYWSGAWKSPKGKKAADKETEKGKSKGKGKAKQIGEVSYDSDVWLDGASSSSLPSQSSTGKDQPSDAIMKAMRMWMESSVDVPEEAKQILSDLQGRDALQDLKKDQSNLNRRRKAFVKVNRLKEALDKKHKRFKAFKASIKDQLVRETKKYESDVQEIKEALALAEVQLEQIEKGMDVEEEPEPVEDNELALSELIMDSDEETKERNKLKHTQAQLRHSQAESQNLRHMVQTYAEKMEQMQTQLANLQGATVPQNFMNMAPQEIAKAFASTASSPQNPNPQKRDPLAPFGVAGRSRPREGPYTPQGGDGKDPKEEKKEKTEDEKIAQKIADGMD